MECFLFVHYRIYKSSPLFPILGQINSVHTTSSYYFKLGFMETELTKTIEIAEIISQSLVNENGMHRGEVRGGFRIGEALGGTQAVSVLLMGGIYVVCH
jgi:hypothetical protein